MIDWNKEIAEYLNLGANPDAKLGKVLTTIGNAVAASVEQSIGSAIDEQEYSEVYNGTGMAVMYLRHAPIIRITSFMRRTDVLTVGDPFAAPSYPPAQVIVPWGDPLSRNRVMLTDGSMFGTDPNGWIISYTAGWQRDPGLVFAVTKWAAQIFRDRDRLGIQSESIGNQSTSFTRAIPDDVKAMLQPYKPLLLPPL